MHDHVKFDDIVWSDLEGDNSALLITTFVTRLANSPPISPQRNQPYSSATLKEVLGHVVRRLRAKFGSQSSTEIFPDEEVKRWKKKIQDGRNRTMMEGEEESEIAIQPLHCWEDPLPEASYGRHHRRRKN